MSKAKSVFTSMVVSRENRAVLVKLKTHHRETLNDVLTRLIRDSELASKEG